MESHGSCGMPSFCFKGDKVADVQLENGYTQIANDILDAFGKIRISGEARQVLDVIIRKTYGFKKHEDRIALSQFCLATGINKVRVCHALTKLYEMNLIAKKDTPIGNIYRFNKDFDTWKPLPKKITLPKKIMGIAKKDNETLPKKIHTKETITKETITKDKYLVGRRKKPSDPNIKIFLEYAKKTFLSIKKESLHIDWGKDGAITKSLLGTYGLEKLKALWDKFLSSQDEWILKSGFSIGVFKSVINKLVSGGGQTDDKRWDFLKRDKATGSSI